VSNVGVAKSTKYVLHVFLLTLSMCNGCYSAGGAYGIDDCLSVCLSVCLCVVKLVSSRHSSYRLCVILKKRGTRDVKF